MNNEFKNLQDSWQQQQKELQAGSLSFEQMVSQIESKTKKGVSFHYGNIIILLLTIIGLLLFFYFVAPVQEILSRIGVGFMTVGLALRVFIEIGSALRTTKINKLDTALKTAQVTIDFYKFRGKVHGALTHTIFVLYIVGFYMISPEFSLYFSFWKMILMDVSFVIIIAIIYVQMRKGNQKEMKMLGDVIALKKEIEQA